MKHIGFYTQPANKGVGYSDELGIDGTRTSDGPLESAIHINRILDTQPTKLFALYPLSETTGLTALDIVGGYNGTYNAGVTLDAITFPDGSPAPLFSANAHTVTLPVAALDEPFDPTLGSAGGWIKVRAESVWSSATLRTAWSLGADVNNRLIPPYKAAIANQMTWYYDAGGASLATSTACSLTTWIHAMLTWNKSANRCRWYVNGVQQGTDLAGVGNWVGALSNNFTAIGNYLALGGTNFWDGYVKYFGIWRDELIPPEVANLAVSAYQV